MSGLTLRLRAPLPDAIDARSVFAPGWSALDPAALARREVTLPDATAVPLGELFTVEALGEPGHATVTGDLGRLAYLGAGLAEGRVLVDGSAGRGVGAGMRGGWLEVRGDVGDDAGVAMAGGALLVHGDAGHRAGAAAPGAKRGMTGGELVVLGSAGDEAGARMRRGIVAVAGAVGAAAGAAMLAGTVVATGFGPDAGLFSRRGTLVALGHVDPPATYRLAAIMQPVIVRLLLRHLRDRYAFPVAAAHIDGFYRRFSGDFAETGKGEILAWTA
jgi:formylmethanofuran dehydrogenase subunit C